MQNSQSEVLTLTIEPRFKESENEIAASLQAKDFEIAQLKQDIQSSQQELAKARQQIIENTERIKAALHESEKQTLVSIIAFVWLIAVLCVLGLLLGSFIVEKDTLNQKNAKIKELQDSVAVI